MLFTSCKSEDEVVLPIFPDMVMGSIPVGETTCDITFTPNLDWTVSIPTDSETAQWFDLLDGDMAVSSISGKASTTPVTVTVVTSDQELFDMPPRMRGVAHDGRRDEGYRYHYSKLVTPYVRPLCIGV